MKNKALWIIIAILVVVIIWLTQCNGKKNEQPQPPPVKPVHTIVAEVKNNEDSIQAITAPLEQELQAKDNIIAKVSNELLSGQDKILKLQQDNDSLLSLLKAGELTNSLNESAERIKAQIRKNDSLCNKNISALNRQITLKSSIINQKDKLYSKLKSSLDTCLKNQSALEKYAKDIKPRNKLALGVVSNIAPVFGIGVGADFIHKKGYVFSGSVMTMQKDYFIQIGFKKIITFR